MPKKALTIMVHSYKGGTGKSLISLNFACTLVSQGKKVALLDFDFLGPGMFSSFKKYRREKTKFLNDVFFNPNSNVDIEEVLLNVKDPTDPEESEFLVGLANPEPSEINNLSRLNKNQFMEAFRKILLVQEFLRN